MILWNFIVCGDVWIEYQDFIWDVVEEIVSCEFLNVDDIVEVLWKVVFKLMVRGEENWSFDIVDDFSDKKYQYY